MGMGSFDVSGLERLRDRIGRINHDEFIKQQAMQLALRLIALTKDKTPVDTGNLRRNWAMGSVEKLENEYVVTVLNNVDYASLVEYGHRNRNHTGWVRGRYMLTMSENELKEQAPAILARKIEEFLREAFRE